MEIGGLEKCTGSRGGEPTTLSLTVLPGALKPKIKPSRASRWRAGVLIGLHMLFAAHVAHYLSTGSTISPLEPSEGMEAVKNNIINTGAVFFLLAIVATAIFGRFFCGWGCHIVALQDLCSWLLGKIGIRPKPMKSKLLLWVPLLAFLYMFVWPGVYRAGLFVQQLYEKQRTGASMSEAISAAWEHPLVFPDVQLHLVTEDFWKTFPGLGVSLFTLFVAGFAVIYFLGAKGFCTYGCPYGAAFAIADKFAPGRIRVTDACEGCGHCTAVCTSNVRVHEEVRDFGMVVDPGCMKCMDCVSVCPNEALYFGFGGLPAAARGKGRNAEKPRVAAARTKWGDYRWQQEMLLGVLFATAFFVYRGLYGLVPFLLTLGIAAIVAYLGERAIAMLGTPNMTMHGVALKRRGRLVAGGLGLLGVVIAIAALTVHSAYIQINQSIGENAYDQSASSRDNMLRADFDPSAIEKPQLAIMHIANSSLTRVEHYALFPQPEINVRQAYLSLALGQPDDFERRMKQSLIDFPRDPTVRADLAEFYAQRQRPAEALGLFREAAHLAPRELRPHMSLGLLLASQQRFSEALAAFDHGLTHLPDSADLAFAAGVAAANAGDSAAAIDRFTRAVQLRPDAIPARENLIGLLLGENRVADAERELLKLVELAPSNREAWSTLAQLARARGDQSAAKAHEAEAAAIQFAPRKQ